MFLRNLDQLAAESARLNSYAALASILGPILFGPIAWRFNKYQTMIVIALVGAILSYTSLLLIPPVVRTPRHPNIVFDCSNNMLRMERCNHWENSCQVPQKAAKGNFTNFTLTKCKYVCPSIGTMNSSWYPLHVCFISGSEGNLCLVHDPEDVDKGIPIDDTLSAAQLNKINSKSTQVDHALIQFESRFDRWPIASGSAASSGECAFQTLAPLLVNHRPYESIQCRPYVHSCSIHCKTNLLHRPRNSPNSSPRPPAPCYDIAGDPKTTFYAYLAVRSAADFFLFAAYTLIDGLAVTLLSNYDALYGGVAKLLAIVTPMIVFPTLCGFLVDYYSQVAGHPDYSPPFVVFDGLMLITITLVIASPATPLIPLANTNRAASQSQTSLRGSSPSLLRSSSRSGHKANSSRRRIPFRNWYILVLWLLPITLLSGTAWGVMQAYLQPFYLQLGATKFWIGLSFSVTYVCLAPFSYLAKPLISGIGRLHLIALCFVFYALRLAGVSFLSQPKWTLLPFEAMEAFTLPIAWLGITSYAHALIATNSIAAGEEPITRSTLNLAHKKRPPKSKHLVMQHLLNILHFGVGRFVGASLLLLWLRNWDDTSRRWDWLNNNDSELPELDPVGFRILLRLMAIAAACVAMPFLFVYHLCGHVVQGFILCLLGLKECGLRCKACCKTACNALCCCSCQFNMCRLCQECNRRRRKKAQLVPDKPTASASATSVACTASTSNCCENGNCTGCSGGDDHPASLATTTDCLHSRLIDHHSGGNSTHATCSNATSVNGSAVTFELRPNHVDHHHHTRPKLANGGHHHHHHRPVRMADVLGDDESLLSAPR